MKDENIYVTRAALPDYEEYCSLIKQIWDNHILTNNGPLHQKLEKELKDYCKVEYLSLFTNGHMALENALASLDLKGEVITTPFTFVSTTNSIVRNGLKPVFCDIKSDDYTIDPTKIEELITDSTCAILPVHVYGNICDVEAINEIAKKYNLKVIYDAAHAFGEKYKGIPVGNFGDISMFSFHATKVFNTIEGGCLTCSDLILKDKFEKMKNFGIVDPEHVDYIGGNAKMNEFQAAMGLCNLKHLDSNISKRKKLLQYYRSLLQDIKGVQLNKMDKDVSYNFSYFPVVLLDDYGLTRDELVEKLNENKIFPRKYFYPVINDLECYSNFKDSNTPVARDIASRVLTLPLYPDLEKETVKEICCLIKKYERR